MFIRSLTLAFTAVLLVCSTDVYAMGGRRGGGGSGSTSTSSAGSQGGAYNGGGDSSNWHPTLYLGDESHGTTGTYYGSQDQLASAPEPATLLLLASGAAGAISWRARRKK